MRVEMHVLGGLLIAVAVGVAAYAIFAPPVEESTETDTRGFWQRLLDACRQPRQRALLSVGLGLLTFAPTGNMLVMGVATVLVWWAIGRFFTYLDRRGGRRRDARLREQLPSALTTIAGALQAGQTVEQALGLAADSLMPPLGDELRQTCRELALGVSLEEALQGLRERCGIEELDMAACGLTMHNEIGSDLIGFFESTARLSTARENIRKELWAATAAPRLSITLLIALPWAFALLANMATKLLNPGGASYMEPLLMTSAGKWFIFAAIAMQVIGWLVSRKIVEVEV